MRNTGELLKKKLNVNRHVNKSFYIYEILLSNYKITNVYFFYFYSNLIA